MSNNLQKYFKIHLISKALKALYSLKQKIHFIQTCYDPILNVMKLRAQKVLILIDFDVRHSKVLNQGRESLFFSPALVEYGQYFCRNKVLIGVVKYWKSATYQSWVFLHFIPIFFTPFFILVKHESCFLNCFYVSSILINLQMEVSKWNKFLSP